MSFCVMQFYDYQYWLVYFWYHVIPTCSICLHQQVVNTLSCTCRCFELAGITMCFTHDKDIIACQQNTLDHKDLRVLKDKVLKNHMSLIQYFSGLPLSCTLML